MRALRPVLLVGLFLLVLVPLRPPCTVWAQEPTPQPGPPPDEPPEEEEPGFLERVVRYVLFFPVETMQAATENLLVNILRRNAEGIRSLFSGLVADLTLQNPGIKEPSDSLMWRGVDIFAPTWRFTVKIAVALWPATLAIMAATAAQESAISTNWGVAGLKGALARWLGGVLACAFSLEIIDLANRLSNAIILGIVTLSIHGATDLSMQTVVNMLLGAALRLFGMEIAPAAAIIAVLVELVLGLALVISIIGQYFARVALLYIIVALAPIVLVIGILRPARWLQWLWLKGLLLVMLLGPITALLFKLALALHVAVVNPILSFLMVVGVTSVLLAINGAIIKGVFGAALEVVGRAVETATGVMQGMGTAAIAVGGAVLTGGAALGVLPAALGGAGGGVAVAGVGASAGGSSAGVTTGALAAGSEAGGPAGGVAKGTTGGAAGTIRTSPAGAAAGEKARAAAVDTSLHAPEAQPGPDTGELTSAIGSAGNGEPAASQGKSPAREGGSPAGSTQSVGVTMPGYWERLRRRWRQAEPHERTEAVGAAMRAAGAVLGPRSLAGRTMGAVGMGLQAGANRQAEEPAAQQHEMGSGAAPPDTNLMALSADEIQGYQRAMRDVRRDLRAPMQAAGLDLRQIEQDALAPVWAAAQHDTLANVARQAGFGDRPDTASMVSDFVAYRIEGQLMAQGFLSERITRPGAPPVIPLSDSPALIDYDRGQQMAWAVRSGDMAAYAGLHHALRRYADTPQAGLDAATRFYNAALENPGVAGVIEAAREYGVQAGVPEERLEPWLQELQAA